MNFLEFLRVLNYLVRFEGFLISNFDSEKSYVTSNFHCTSRHFPFPAPDTRSKKLSPTRTENNSAQFV